MSLTFDSCRICLNIKPDDSVKSLALTPIDLGISYAKIYQDCMGLDSINIKTYLPSFLCFDCEKLLLKFHKFRIKCLKTEDLLNGLLAIKAENDNQCSSNDGFDSMDEILTAEDENERTEQEVKQESAVNVKDEYTEEDVEERKPQLKLKIKLTDDEPYMVKRKPKRFHQPSEGLALDKVAKRKVRNERESRKEICPQCGKFIVHRYMKLHLITHIDMTEEEKPFQCDQCLKRFKFSSVLAKHKDTHTGLKKYKCDYCELTFARSDGKRYHIMIKHLNEKPFQCTHCDMRFTHGHHLNRHQRVHTLERNFECELCNKKLASKASVAEHMATHTNELNFICDVCSKGFKTKKYLKRHYVVHTGEKNYSCPACNEKFAYNVLLKAHSAKMHPNFILPPSGTLMSERAIRRIDEDNKKFLKIPSTKSLVQPKAELVAEDLNA